MRNEINICFDSKCGRQFCMSHTKLLEALQKNLREIILYFQGASKCHTNSLSRHMDLKPPYSASQNSKTTKSLVKRGVQKKAH